MLTIFQKFIFLQSRIFDLILYPVRELSPFTVLMWISAWTGLLMVSIYGVVSNQEKIKTVKDKIKRHFLEIRLYKDDLSEMLQAPKNIFKANMHYLGLSFIPGTVLVCIVFFILVQLHSRFSYQPLTIDKEVCASIKLKESADRTDVEMILPEGIRLDSPLLFIPATNEFNWRIVAEKDGVYTITFRVKGKEIKKLVAVGKKVLSISPKRTQSGWEDFLNFPVEDFISEDIPVQEISISLPEREIEFLFNGKSYHWLIIFFPAALIFGLIFKKILGIA